MDRAIVLQEKARWIAQEEMVIAIRLMLHSFPD
uniref:Uncharacterized protein n=1 Tax=Cyanothece sp. (strain PCC 7425 / ATCC 29141) TaxID=395961 RepID=B8HY95_CYAP4